MSVYQLLGHIVLVPMAGAVMVPLLVYDFLPGNYYGWGRPANTSAVLHYLWISSSVCLGCICLEFAAATFIRYRAHHDLYKRLVACALLPFMFMGLLPLASIRAFWRESNGKKNWEKTPHRGETRSPATAGA
jgi:ABC-type spermidine/putrescine transport system permease subunit I